MNVFKSYAELVFISKQVYVCVCARGVCVCVCVCVDFWVCSHERGAIRGQTRCCQ